MRCVRLRMKWACICVRILAVFLVVGGASPGQEVVPSLGKSKPAITALAVTPEGTSYVQGSQAGVVVRSFTGGNPQTIPIRLEQVNALAFAPERDALAIAGGVPGE